MNYKTLSFIDPKIVNFLPKEEMLIYEKEATEKST